MFATISQGLEVYKEELRKHLEWRQERQEVYGAQEQARWSEADQKKASLEEAQLIGMERALGFDERELMRYTYEIDKEFQSRTPA